MNKDFLHYCQTQHPKAGELWAWASADGKRFVSLLTQVAAYDHGAKPGKVSTQHVGNALRALSHLRETVRFTNVALPRLAACVGGLEWPIVPPLAQPPLGDLNIPIVVHSTYRSCQKAKESMSSRFGYECEARCHGR